MLATWSQYWQNILSTDLARRPTEPTLTGVVSVTTSHGFVNRAKWFSILHHTVCGNFSMQPLLAKYSNNCLKFSTVLFIVVRRVR